MLVTKFQLSHFNSFNLIIIHILMRKKLKSDYNLIQNATQNILKQEY